MHAGIHACAHPAGRRTQLRVRINVRKRMLVYDRFSRETLEEHTEQ